MEQPVLISVREVAEHAKRWESRGGLIRLNLLVNRNMRRIDELKKAVLTSRRISNVPLPFVARAHVRDRVSAKDAVTDVPDQYGGDMVERTSHVIDDIAEDYAQSQTSDELSCCQDRGTRVAHRVVASLQGLSVPFHRFATQQSEGRGDIRRGQSRPRDPTGRVSCRIVTLST